jgi:uncharacterized protein YbjT (DUF2867 family)
MHVILGATGHVGSAVALALLDRREPVTVVTRDERRAEPYTRRGATPAVADVHDADALRAVLARGRSAFLLMPPAEPSTDTVAEERRTVSSIARALEGTSLQKVVQSTYGAQPGEGIGLRAAIYQISPLDPVTLGAATGILALSSIAASIVPARRCQRSSDDCAQKRLTPEF